ncbi:MULTISPECIES: MFS transporter [Thermomonosporaceae]|uniref:MFS transporter n=1 Tax=Thermomonosporaceae TaxID=2012 RepID=UPI00255B0BE3|nr:MULTISPECIES: MFS transporter [Thermomonosporaceae]MDL4771798.1 MFS transporter [Actinomadura xylanilytica]
MARGEIEGAARAIDANGPDPDHPARAYAALPAVRKRAARAAVSGVFFVNGTAFASWAARVPAVRDGLGMSDGGLAVALAGLAAGAFAGLPLAGGLVARWGSRRVMVGGAALYLGAMPVIALAPGLAWLTAILAVFAIGNSTVDVAMNTQGVLVERAYGRPVLGGFHAMFSLGAVVGAAAGGLAASAGVSVGAHLLTIAIVLSFVCAGATFFLLPDAPKTDDSPFLALPTRELWPAGLIAFCALMGEGLMNDWGSVYLHDVADSSAGAAATGFAVFSAGMVAGRLAADRVRAFAGADRFVLGCAVLAGCGSVLAIALPNPHAGLAGYALIGLGLAAVVPVAFSHAARFAPDRPGLSIAAVSTVGYVGFLAGPPIMGGIAETTGLRAAMLVFLILMGAMVSLAPRLRPG